jgi:hypothetical protein
MNAAVMMNQYESETGNKKKDNVMQYKKQSNKKAAINSSFQLTSHAEYHRSVTMLFLLAYCPENRCYSLQT